MQNDFKRLVLLPHEIKTELAGIGILEIYPFMIISSYLRQHLIQCNIVENNGLCTGCRVCFDGVCW